MHTALLHWPFLLTLSTVGSDGFAGRPQDEDGALEDKELEL